PRIWQRKEEEIVSKILDSEVTVSTRELLKVPAIQEALEKTWRKKECATKWSAAKVFVQDSEEESVMTQVNIDDLPQPSYHISKGEEEGIPKGSVVHEDCVATFLEQLPPGDRPKMVYVARDLQVLRSLYPSVNDQAKVEAILDSGSQIVCMALDKALSLGLTWDPDIRLRMESANQQVNESLGMAKNVPF
ncbi:hypothetical protein H2248_003329, partial [Termitomyces sp. 'cryptogamus']